MRSTMVRVSSAPDNINVVIAPGKKGLHIYKYPSAIVGPTWIEWDFEVEEYEIDFWVEAAPAAGGEATRLFPQPGSTEGTSMRWEGRRYKAGTRVSGHLELQDLGAADTPMAVKLVFSNQTSWTRERKVKYAARSWPLLPGSSEQAVAVKRSAEEESILAVASRLAGLAMHGKALDEADMRLMLFQPTTQGRTSQRFDEVPEDAPPTKKRLLLAVASCAPTRSPNPRPSYHLDQPYVTIIKGLRAWQDATGKALLAVAPEPPVLPVTAIESPPVGEDQHPGEGPQQAAAPPVLPKRMSFIQLIDLVREELQYDITFKPREVIKQAADDLGIELRVGAGKRGEIEQIALSLGLIEEEPEPEPERETEPESNLQDVVDPEPEPETELVAPGVELLSKNHPTVAVNSAVEPRNGLSLQEAVAWCRSLPDCEGMWYYDNGRCCPKASWDDDTFTKVIAGGAFYRVLLGDGRHGLGMEPEPEPQPELVPQQQFQAAPESHSVAEQETGLLEEDLREPDADRELELDEPRWYKQTGMEWTRYDAAACRKIEQGYRVYKDEERAWMQQQVAQFEQERVARDTGHRESMSANLSGAGIVQKRDHPKFDLAHRCQLDFENMREVNKDERGGQKRVKVKREEPTEEDRNQAKDSRTRQSILQEFVLSESAYLDALEELDKVCFAELRKVEPSNMTHACEALSTAFDALLRLHRMVVTQLEGQIGAIAKEEAVAEEETIAALKTCILELKDTYAAFLVHWGTATQEVTRACPHLLGTRVQSKIDGLLSEPMQRLNRYRAFTGKLVQSTADTLPEFEAYRLLSDECEEILVYMVKQPKMGDFQQMRMPISSTQGDTQVPNTVLWFYIDTLWGHVQQEAERLSAINGIAMQKYPFDETDVGNVEEQVARVQRVIEHETSTVLCVVLVCHESGCAEHVEKGIAAVSTAAHQQTIKVLKHGIGEDSKLESADAISRNVLTHEHAVMDMRVLQILEKGAVVCEQVFELQQVRFGKWGKPTAWPEFCRSDGSAAEQPDVRLLPFEAGGVWIWLGEWKVQGGDDTDAEGWQYMNTVARGKALPQVGWANKHSAMAGLRRRKHWCFRQRLATTDGYKLESADWTFVRDFQAVVRKLTWLTTESMSKNVSWSEQRTVELQMEAHEAVKSVLMSEDGSQERDRGSDEIATWLAERLSTGTPEVAWKTLLIIGGLIDRTPTIPDSFRSILRMRTADAIRAAMTMPPTTPTARTVARMSTECHRRFEQVQLPSQANCAEADLLRVYKMLQRLQNDPLRWELTKREQEFMWSARREPLLSSSPRMLSVVLLAVPNWESDANDAHALLDVWQRLSPSEAIQLLDCRFWRCAQQQLGSAAGAPTSKPCADPARVFAPFRTYAVQCLEELDDTLLCSYLLQLALVLRTEDLNKSSLAAFLLRRALAAPFTVGHSFYWSVRAEMAACLTAAAQKEGASMIEQYSVFLRLGLLLRTYLDLSGEHRDELLAEELLVDSLRNLVKIGKATGAGAASVSSDLMDELERIDCTLPEHGVRLPIDAQKHVSGVVATKCRVMSSATKPLMLHFKKFGAADANQTVGLMFKDGDDLRQDALCLQIFGLMKRLWGEAGLDVPLTVYKATDLGAEVGMLELVTGAETLSAISVSQRVKGQSNVAAVLDIKKMALWLESECQSVGVCLEDARENFLRSSAGYCVATYVLGIGDRHNDNIMMKKDGHLVHIDFGYILGKNPVIPTPFGFTIERYNSEVFAFLPDFGYIIGGEDFQSSANFARFQELCCECYLVVRQHAHLFINLFSLLLPAGLYQEEELAVMRQRLNLEEEDEVAVTIFRALIVDSLGSLSTKFNWAIHTAKHVGL